MVIPHVVHCTEVQVVSVVIPHILLRCRMLSGGGTKHFTEVQDICGGGTTHCTEVQEEVVEF